MPSLTLSSRTDWAEEDDEDTIQLPQQHITKNRDGTETIVAYATRDDGKKIKTTQRIRKTVVKQIVNPRVAERKQWAKFGSEKGKPVGPQTDTTSIAENIVFRPMVGWKATAEDKSETEKKAAKLKDAKIKCRICTGDHWTTKCPFKDTMQPEGEAASADIKDDAPEPAGQLGGGSSSYVPPHLRNHGGVGEKMGNKYERDDLATLRVTNVGATLPFGTVADGTSGQRIRRRTGLARHVLALWKGHPCLLGEREAVRASQGLRLHQLPRPR